MSKPDWCPQRVWDDVARMQVAIHAKQSTELPSRHNLIQTTEFARAILAVEQREREACQVACQKEADDAKGASLPQAAMGALWCVTAIRNRGSSHD